MKSTAEIVTAKLRAMSKETFSNSLSELKAAERESVRLAITELDRMLRDIAKNEDQAPNR